MTALRTTIASIIPTSIKSPYCFSTTATTAEITAAAIRTITITLVNCKRNFLNTLSFLRSFSLFSPYLFSLSHASASESPLSVVPSSARVSSTDFE